MGLKSIALVGVSCAVLAACAADAPANANRSRLPASTAAGAGNTSEKGVQSSPMPFDNPGGVLQPPDASLPRQTPTPTPVMTMPPGAEVAARMPISIDQTGADNPAGLPDADVKKLIAGGPAGAMKWLYPYEGTVFPRGMLAPLLMWDGPAADVVYLHIKAQAFEYKAVLKLVQGALAKGPQLQIPQDVWDKAGQQTHGKTDPFSVELTTRAAGVVAGPITLHFTIAQATVKGSIYYNTYASKLPGAAIGGNVLRIPPGGTAELFLSSKCNGCHSVAADGSRIISQIELTTGGASYLLISGGAPNPMGTMAGPRTAFGALYPDGSKYLTTSVTTSVAHAATAGPGAPVDATLYDTTTGQVVPGTGVPAGALMPTFSQDGKHLVFNDWAIKNAHGLAAMDYDTQANKASNYKLLVQEPDGTTRPGWPFFLPDAKAVVFVRTDSADFTGGFAASDLYIADLATGTVTILAKAMGYNSPTDAANNTTYLPFGAADLHHNYYPTVSAVAAGGYFWIFFDAYRHYGNMGLIRQLLGAAIDIAVDGRYEHDPSHPAFYLPGQEFGTGNHRAFAALDPCKKDGDSCTSGIDCCGGFCSVPVGTNGELLEPVGTCSPETTPCAGADCTTAMCAKRDERCTTSVDCCPPASDEPENLCIAGFCAFVPLN